MLYLKLEHYLLLVGGLSAVSIACGCFGLYQYFVFERKRKRRVQRMCKQFVPAIRTVREYYKCGELVTKEVRYEKAR